MRSKRSWLCLIILCIKISPVISNYKRSRVIRTWIRTSLSQKRSVEWCRVACRALVKHCNTPSSGKGLRSNRGSLLVDWIHPPFHTKALPQTDKVTARIIQRLRRHTVHRHDFWPPAARLWRAFPASLLENTLFTQNCKVLFSAFCTCSSPCLQFTTQCNISTFCTCTTVLPFLFTTQCNASSVRHGLARDRCSQEIWITTR